VSCRSSASAGGESNAQKTCAGDNIPPPPELRNQLPTCVRQCGLLALSQERGAPSQIILLDKKEPDANCDCRTEWGRGAWKGSKTVCSRCATGHGRQFGLHIICLSKSAEANDGILLWRRGDGADGGSRRRGASAICLETLHVRAAMSAKRNKTRPMRWASPI